MRSLALVAIAALLLPSTPAAATPDEDALALAADVRGQAVYDRIAELTQDGSKAHRLVGTVTHDNAKAWIVQEFRELGYEPKEFAHECSGPNGVVLGPTVVQRFPEGQHVPVPASSVLALLPGKNATEWVVIGGHYDTQESTVGALDNAAGIGIILTLAQVFRKHADNLDAGILFAAWDCEEWGVWGSREFVDRLADVGGLFGLAPGSVRIRMAEGLDMPGLSYPAQNTWRTYHKGAFSVFHIRTSPIDTFGYKGSYGEYNKANYTPEQLAGFVHFRQVAKHAAYDLLELPPQWVWVEDDTHGRSDHVPFIAKGIPGMRVHGPSDEEYPPYHGPTDTLPVLEESAGGKEPLTQGLETAARFAGISAMLMAEDASGKPPDVDAAVPGTPRSTPGFAEPLMVLGVLVVSGLGRRRVRRRR